MLDVRFLSFRGRIIAKRINVRIEHVKHSNCRLDFLRRVEENEKKKKEAKALGITVNCKRIVSIIPSTHQHLFLAIGCNRLEPVEIC